MKRQRTACVMADGQKNNTQFEKNKPQQELGMEHVPMRCHWRLNERCVFVSVCPCTCRHIRPPVHHQPPLLCICSHGPPIIPNP